MTDTTCATATNNEARYLRAEELDLRLLQVVDLASLLATEAFDCRHLDEPLSSFHDAILDPDLQHPSLKPLAAIFGAPGWGMNEWEEKRDYEQEVRAVNANSAADAQLFGFGVQFGTPVRTYLGSCYEYSWGYYNTVWVYAESIAQAWQIGCAWAEQKHLAARTKAGITPEDSPAE